MRILIVTSLITIYSSIALTKVICNQPPVPPSQLPGLRGCRELIEDVFAISRLEDDEKILWSHNPPEGAGSRKLPFIFTSPSVNNDCEILVDSVKKDANDTFAVRDVGERATEIVKLCLDPEVAESPTIGAEAVGPKREIAVILLKEIPPPPVGENRMNGSAVRTAVALQLLLEASGKYGAFLGHSTS